MSFLSRFHLDFIQVLSRFYPDFIQILSRFSRNSLYPNFIQILSLFYMDKIQMKWRLNRNKIWIKGHGRHFSVHNTLLTKDTGFDFDFLVFGSFSFSQLSSKFGDIRVVEQRELERIEWPEILPLHRQLEAIDIMKKIHS